MVLDRPNYFGQGQIVLVGSNFFRLDPKYILYIDIFEPVGDKISDKVGDKVGDKGGDKITKVNLCY